jgi:RNA 3'-terminal phosphate cyclase (ATP)
MLTIDGDMGEGGGQILRTALSLSLCLRQPFHITRIRARRRQPGLRRQHLVAVQAAARISKAEMSGAELGSGDLTFIPHTLQPGPYTFDIGSAGSTTLVSQTLLPALVCAASPSCLLLTGGTHNPMAPPFDFLQLAFLPVLKSMGANIQATLKRPGFYPVGGGILEVAIRPVSHLTSLSLLERGHPLDISAIAILANLPLHIAQRELEVLHEALSLDRQRLHIRQTEAQGQGNALLVIVKSEHITEVFSSMGEHGVRAETVAARLAPTVLRYLRAEVPVGLHLADQLLLPMALFGGGAFITLSPDPHTLTNIEVLRRFLDIDILTERLGSDRWHIQITGHKVCNPSMNC